MQVNKNSIYFGYFKFLIKFLWISNCYIYYSILLFYITIN